MAMMGRQSFAQVIAARAHLSPDEAQPAAQSCGKVRRSTFHASRSSVS